MEDIANMDVVKQMLDKVDIENIIKMSHMEIFIYINALISNYISDNDYAIFDNLIKSKILKTSELEMDALQKQIFIGFLKEMDYNLYFLTNTFKDPLQYITYELSDQYKLLKNLSYNWKEPPRKSQISHESERNKLFEILVNKYECDLQLMNKEFIRQYGQRWLNVRYYYFHEFDQ